MQLQEKATTAGTSNSNNGSEGVSTLRLVRAGLVLDEYRMHTGDGDVPHKEELYRRVEAAISLSRPEDSCEDYECKISPAVRFVFRRMQFISFIFFALMKYP